MLIIGSAIACLRLIDFTIYKKIILKRKIQSLDPKTMNCILPINSDLCINDCDKYDVLDHELQQSFFLQT